MKYFALMIAMVLFSATAFSQSATPPSNKIWNKLLKEYVDDAGLVNYKGFIKDKAEFQTYLDALSTNPPQDSWTRNDQEAYWINAYNAFTIKLIMDHYPVKSIKDIGPKRQIPFLNTPWQKKFFKIGKKRFKLDRIEHHILRKKFDDPRVHFALVCASKSCAKLRNEAYEGEKVDAQLTEQSKDFLSDKRKNIITDPKKVQLSPYFDWYKKDFKKNGTVISFINKYAPVKIAEDAEVEFMDYNWNLNEQ